MTRAFIRRMGSEFQMDSIFGKKNPIRKIKNLFGLVLVTTTVIHTKICKSTSLGREKTNFPKNKIEELKDLGVQKRNQ